MKQLLKVGLILLACFALPKFVRAEAYIIPQDSHGQIPSDANLSGVDVLETTSTVTGGLGSPVLLYWIAVSSDAATNFVTLRDTDTLNTSSNIKMVIFPNGDGGTSVTGGTTMVKFNPPVIFRNGISFNVNATPSGSVGTNSRGRWEFGVHRRSIGNANGKDVAFSDTAD